MTKVSKIFNQKRVLILILILSNVVFLGIRDTRGRRGFTLHKTIKNPKEQKYDDYVATVVMNTKYLAINYNNTDIIYLHDFNGKLIYKFNNPKPKTTWGFGAAMAMNDNYLLVKTVLSESGHLGYVQKRNKHIIFLYNLNGELIHTFDSPNGDKTKWINTAIAINNNRIAISNERKYVYLYKINGELIKLIKDPNTITGDFGYSLAMNNDYLLVGAPREFGDSSTADSVHFYNSFNGESVFELSYDLRYVGRSVAISDDHALVYRSAFHPHEEYGSCHSKDVPCRKSSSLLYKFRGNLLDTLLSFYKPRDGLLRIFTPSEHTKEKIGRCKQYTIALNNNRVLMGGKNEKASYLYNFEGDLIEKYNHSSNLNLVSMNDKYMVIGTGNKVFIYKKESLIKTLLKVLGLGI